MFKIGEDVMYLEKIRAYITQVIDQGIFGLYKIRKIDGDTCMARGCELRKLKRY